MTMIVRNMSAAAVFAAVSMVCAMPVLAQEEVLPELAMEPDAVASALGGSSVFAGLPIFSGESEAVGALLPGGFEAMSLGGGSRPMGGVICPTRGGLSKGSSLSVLTGPLALSDEQYEKFYAIRNQFLDKVSPKMVELANLQRQLKDTLTSPEIDGSKAKSIGHKVSNLKAELTNLRTERTIALANALTTDQRKALRQAMIKGSCPGGGDSKMMMRRLMMKDQIPQF